jgi:hypothetical protein
LQTFFSFSETGSCYVTWLGLEIDPFASGSWKLGLLVCATVPDIFIVDHNRCSLEILQAWEEWKNT